MLPLSFLREDLALVVGAFDHAVCASLRFWEHNHFWPNFYDVPFCQWKVIQIRTCVPLAVIFMTFNVCVGFVVSVSIAGRYANLAFLPERDKICLVATGNFSTIPGVRGKSLHLLLRCFFFALFVTARSFVILFSFSESLFNLSSFCFITFDSLRLLLAFSLCAKSYCRSAILSWLSSLKLLSIYILSKGGGRLGWAKGKTRQRTRWPAYFPFF